MKTTSLVLMGLSLSSGIGGILLLAANLLVWAVLTFWVGSLLAFAGFMLIAWALRPGRDNQPATGSDTAEHGRTSDTAEPATS